MKNLAAEGFLPARTKLHTRDGGREEVATIDSNIPQVVPLSVDGPIGFDANGCSRAFVGYQLTIPLMPRVYRYER